MLALLWYRTYKKRKDKHLISEEKHSETEVDKDEMLRENQHGEME